MWFSQWTIPVLAFLSSVVVADTKYWQDNPDVKMLPVGDLPLLPCFVHIFEVEKLTICYDHVATNP